MVSLPKLFPDSPLAVIHHLEASHSSRHCSLVIPASSKCRRWRSSRLPPLVMCTRPDSRGESRMTSGGKYTFN